MVSSHSHIVGSSTDIRGLLLIFEGKILKIEQQSHLRAARIPSQRPRLPVALHTPSEDNKPNGKTSWKSELGQAGAHRPRCTHCDLFRADRERVQAHPGSIHPVHPPAGVGPSEQKLEVHT